MRLAGLDQVEPQPLARSEPGVPRPVLTLLQRRVRLARRTLAGYEAMAMVRKGQVRDVSGRDMRAQASFVAGLFGMVA